MFKKKRFIKVCLCLVMFSSIRYNENIYKVRKEKDSMVKRNLKQQTKHNVRVRRIAGGYKSQGWRVRADVSGSPAPRTIYGRQPDVIASRGRKMRIVEVETRNSMKKDTSQRNVFRRFARLNKKRKFRTSVV